MIALWRDAAAHTWHGAARAGRLAAWLCTGRLQCRWWLASERGATGRTGACSWQREPSIVARLMLHSWVHKPFLLPGLIQREPQCFGVELENRALPLCTAGRSASIISFSTKGGRLAADSQRTRPARQSLQPCNNMVPDQGRTGPFQFTGAPPAQTLQNLDTGGA